MDLKETSRLMREQDNRGTQYPLFIIQEEREVMTADGRGDRTIYFNSGSQISITDEEYDILDDAEDKEETDEAVLKVLEEAGLEELSDFDPSDWERLEVNDEYVYCDNAGFFFTEKACHDHIEANRHHYNKPRSYVISAWRNHELQCTMRTILRITGDDIPSCYQ